MRRSDARNSFPGDTVKSVRGELVESGEGVVSLLLPLVQHAFVFQRDAFDFRGLRNICQKIHKAVRVIDNVVEFTFRLWCVENQVVNRSEAVLRVKTFHFVISWRTNGVGWRSRGEAGSPVSDEAVFARTDTSFKGAIVVPVVL